MGTSDVTAQPGAWLRAAALLPPETDTIGAICPAAHDPIGTDPRNSSRHAHDSTDDLMMGLSTPARLRRSRLASFSIAWRVTR